MDDILKTLENFATTHPGFFTLLMIAGMVCLVAFYNIRHYINAKHAATRLEFDGDNEVINEFSLALHESPFFLLLSDGDLIPLLMITEITVDDYDGEVTVETGDDSFTLKGRDLARFRQKVGRLSKIRFAQPTAKPTAAKDTKVTPE